MVTKTASKKSLVPTLDPANLLANIKSRVKKLESLAFQSSTIRSQLFIDVYNWVHFMFTNGKIKTEDFGLQSLADSTNKSKHTINTWYYAGLFMAKHRLSASSVSAKSVMNARCLESKSKPADFFKVISAIRKNTHPGQVGDLITTARYNSGSESIKRVARLRRKGKLTKSAMRMELMATLTCMREFFGSDIELTLCNKDGDILLEAS